MTTEPGTADEPAARIREVATVFLRLGFTAFGGPAAHIAMMRRELVQQRKWLGDDDFVDLVGFTNLLPGPNSTELAIHLGERRAGWRGLAVAGACFIGPAVAIVLALAVVYKRYGTTVAADNLLYGIKPVIIAVVVHALVGLGRTVLRRRVLAVVIVATMVAALAGINEVALLLGAGLLVAIATNASKLRSPPMALLPGVFGAGSFVARTDDPSLWTLFGIFLKAGALLFGSGYVLLAFLRHDLVEGTGWLTNQQLLDAIAVGQMTPGPVFSTATFVGYQVAGLPGAAVATAGIFGPSFVFIATLRSVLPRLRRSPWTAAALDGVNAAAVGLMAAVTLQLADAALVDPITVVLAAGCLVAMWRGISTTWLLAVGALVGLLHWL